MACMQVIDFVRQRLLDDVSLIETTKLVCDIMVFPCTEPIGCGVSCACSEPICCACLLTTL